jgi:tRNA dimethylallyltransferase
MPTHLLPLVAIVGPTAVGKSALAIELAQRVNAEIISADSRLFYRGMDIGTAKPSRAEQACVPHHLIDIAAPDEVWSLAMFQQAAHQKIIEIHQRQRLPILVGGTGQYVRAILEGWQVPPVKPNPQLRQVLEEWAAQVSAHGLHQRLAVLDPQAASQIDPTNLRRTIRALEVIFSSGQRFSRQRERVQSPYRSLVIGLNRPRVELYARIDARIEAMIAHGLVEEVRQLLEIGYSPQLPTLTAIGYREIVAVLHQRMTLDEAIQQMKRKTREFVRRQANWFKPDDPDILWFEVKPEITKDIEATVRNWLNPQ